mgnify:CR=1 FL=1
MAGSDDSSSDSDSDSASATELATNAENFKFPQHILDKTQLQSSAINQLKSALQLNYGVEKNALKFDLSLKQILDQISSKIDQFADANQLLNEISFVFYESIKSDLAESHINKRGILDNISTKNRIIGFFKYLQANILDSTAKQFNTCCKLILNFQSFDQYIDLRFFLYFLQKCRISGADENLKNLKHEFHRIILRYFQIKLYQKSDSNLPSKSKLQEMSVQQ